MDTTNQVQALFAFHIANSVIDKHMVARDNGPDDFGLISFILKLMKVGI